MTRRVLAWSIWGVSLAIALAWVVIDLFVEAGETDPGEYVFIVSAILLYATVGASITSRRLGNRIGLIFAWVALAAAVSGACGSYAQLAVERGLPFAAATTWVANIGPVAIIGPIAFLFLIYPTGRPPSRRWWWVLNAMAGAYAITLLLFALTPGIMHAGFADISSRIRNPIALPAAWKGAIEATTGVLGFVVFIGALASVLSLIQRYRRAEATERQQIRWLAWLGVVTVTFIVAVFLLELAGVIPEEGWAVNATFFVLISLIFLGIPITSGVAILRHGLWDLDVVVKKTVQYGALVVVTIAVAITLVLVLPVLFVGIDDVLPGVVGGLLLAGILTWLRHPARRLANRVVYGGRATPYEVLSEFAGRVGETYSTEDVLPRMAQLLSEASGARTARVWLSVGGTMRPEASWPTHAPPAAEVPVEDDRLPSFGDDRAFEVRHQGELLGALTVTEAPDDPITPSKERLVRDLAAQAGLVLRNVRLIEDLRDSRRRIVSAQDERAKKLERDIHDGAQQQLVALSVKLRLAAGLVERDPAKAKHVLEDLSEQTTSTLEDLRDLARGIYPPLLADEGLAAALEAQARRSPTTVTVDPDGVGRYGQDVEAAVYFACLEALNNVAKYAEATTVAVRLAEAEGELRFEVIDDGRGFDLAVAERGSGLQGMSDRLAALGGSLDITSSPSAGTTVTGRIPIERTET